jgi:hypothetical protein
MMPLPTVSGERTDGNSGRTHIAFRLGGGSQQRFIVSMAAGQWASIAADAQRLCQAGYGSEPISVAIEDTHGEPSVTVAIEAEGSIERHGIVNALDFAKRAVEALDRKGEDSDPESS